MGVEKKKKGGIGAEGGGGWKNLEFLPKVFVIY